MKSVLFVNATIGFSENLLLVDIIPIIYIIYTHNFYTVGKPKISAFKLFAACNDPCCYSCGRWQVQYEINIETGVTFFAKFELTLCC